MKGKGLALLLAFTSLPSISFAFDKPPKEAPPPPPQESQGQNPHPGFAWKDGYYKWSGMHYRWSQGHWVNPPRPGGTWVPGNWVKRERSLGICRWSLEILVVIQRFFDIQRSPISRPFCHIGALPWHWFRVCASRRGSNQLAERDDKPLQLMHDPPHGLVQPTA